MFDSCIYFLGFSLFTCSSRSCSYNQNLLWLPINCLAASYPLPQTQHSIICVALTPWNALVNLCIHRSATLATTAINLNAHILARSRRGSRRQGKCNACAAAPCMTKDANAATSSWAQSGNYFPNHLKRYGAPLRLFNGLSQRRWLWPGQLNSAQSHSRWANICFGKWAKSSRWAAVGCSLVTTKWPGLFTRLW